MKVKITIFFICCTIALTAQNNWEAEDFYAEYTKAWYKGDFETARSHLESIISKDFQLSDYHHAIVYKNLAKVLSMQGKHDSALLYFEEAIPYLKNNIQYTSQLAGTYNGIANVYMTIGETVRANSYYNAGIKLLQNSDRNAERNWTVLSILYENQSRVYQKNDERNIEIELLKKAKVIRQKYYPENLGIIYLKLANAFENLNLTDSAINSYQQAIREYTNKNGPEYYMLAEVYMNYAKFNHKIINNEDSEKYFQKALNIYYSTSGPNSPYTANCHAEYARFLKITERYSEASNHINKCINILTMNDSNHKDFSNDKARIQTTKHDLNYIYALKVKMDLFNSWAQIIDNDQIKNDRLLIAKRSGLKALNIYSSLHNIYFTDKSKQLLLKNQKEIILIFYEISRKLYNLDSEKSNLISAYSFIALSKGLDLIHEINITENLKYADLPETLAIKIEKQINNIKTFSITLENKFVDSEFYNNADDNINNKLINSYNKLDSLLAYAKNNNPEFARLMVQPETPDLHEIQQNLERNEVILEYFVGGESENTRRLITFMVNKKELVWADTLLPAETFGSIMELYKTLSMEQVNDPITGAEHNTLLAELYNILIKPFEHKIRNKDLLIVPDEELSYLPFEILLTRNPDQDITIPANYPYLVKNNSISYGYASQLLFSEDHSTQEICFTSIVPQYVHTKENGINPLPLAKKESRTISRYYKHNIVHDGFLSKQEFLQLLEKECNLHLAMHTESDTSNDQAAYFVLTDSTGQIIRCKNYEIEAYDIHAPMVSLVACKTGAGPYYSGDGLSNLSRSFLLAGAESVLHTMWDVEDRVTLTIMEQYYKYLSKGNKKSVALQKAKLDYLSTVSPAFTHPEYWAAFQLTGDIAPVVHKKNILPALIAIGIIGILAGYYLMRARLESKDSARF